MVLASVFPVHAAVPAPESAPDPIEICEPPATVELPLWEAPGLRLDLLEPASLTCDPNRECTTHAQCGEFGYCASWRLCICTG